MKADSWVTMESAMSTKESTVIRAGAEGLHDEGSRSLQSLLATTGGLCTNYARIELSHDIGNSFERKADSPI